MSYIFDKTLAISIICSKCGTSNGKIFKERENTGASKIIGLIDKTDK